MGGREGWALKNADVEALAGGGVPGMVATAAAGQLLVGEENGAVRGSGAGGFKGVGIGGLGDGREMELAGVDGAGESGFEGGEIEHGVVGLTLGIQEVGNPF